MTDIYDLIQQETEESQKWVESLIAFVCTKCTLLQLFFCLHRWNGQLTILQLATVLLNIAVENYGMKCYG